MNNKTIKPLGIRSFPEAAIVHVDGDSFFASCAQMQDPKLRGKPVITGKERGIASSMSQEAKAMGVKRAMSLPEIRKICPNVILIDSDYELYSLMSTRMYKIVRRYTPDVEEYSIDECFADIKGMRRPLRKTYDQIVEGIKHDLETELGTTFSIGLAPNKTLAKVVSKWKKPSGMTVMPLYSAHLYLNQYPIDKVWGIGGQTTLFLKKNGVKTALDYANMPEEWIYSKMTKPHQETWEELRGKFVYKLETGPKTEYKSISKVKTFSPPSKDYDYVFSQLSKNIENACMKARRYNLAPKKFVFFLKTQEFRYKGMDVKLSSPSANPKKLVDIALERFSGLFDSSIEYRSTGVVLQDLEDQPEVIQCDLFGSDDKNYKYGKIFEGVDKLREKYGKHKVYLGSSLLAMNSKQVKDHNVFSPYRRQHLFKGETDRRKVGLPFMGLVS